MPRRVTDDLASRYLVHRSAALAHVRSGTASEYQPPTLLVR